jgi:hypothetical protein
MDEAESKGGRGEVSHCHSTGNSRFWSWLVRVWHRVHKTPRTPEEFQQAYDDAPVSPLSAEEIDSIVKRVIERTSRESGEAK